MGFAFGVGAIAMVFKTPNGLASLLFTPKKRGATTPQASLQTPRIECQAKALQVEHLSVRFGGVHALNNVSFCVQPGQIVGLIGPNGAGKTTLLDAISGFTATYSGNILVDNTDISALNPAQRATHKLSRSFQSLELFDDLNVEEHLRCAWEQSQTQRLLGDLITPQNPALPDWLIHIAQVFELHGVLHCLPRELSFGQRRLLGIARAVAARPSVLLLDEPAAGLDSNESRELGELIQTLAHDWGMGILLIEHDMKLVMNHCEQLVVLDFGTTIATGTPAQVQQTPAVISAYLGHEQEPSNA